MTVQEFKNVFGKLNIRFKRNVPDDYTITNEDIINGNLVQKYIYSNSLTNIVNGFTVINDKICYMYTSLDRIEIISDDVIPPCGGKTELLVFATYSIRKIDETGEDVIYEENKNGKVNAIITLDNDEFEYIKPELIKETPNNTDKINEVNVLATYFYKGKKYTCSKKITQTINSISDWIIEAEPTTSIELTLTPSEIGNAGGLVTAKVERHFSRTYYKKDSCGNKVAGKNEPGHVEDITKKAIITSSNRKIYSVNRSIISVAKQEVGAKSRSGIITARFIDFESTATITQAEGGKISYSYELSFDDGTLNKFIDLETSLKKTIEVPLISKEYKYIDGVLDSVNDTKRLTIVSDSDWLAAKAVKTDKGISLSVEATDVNTDKENDREGKLTIINADDNNAKINLIISQSALEPISETIKCKFYGNGLYTSDELDRAELYFKSYKILRYEDGTSDTSEYNDMMPFETLFASSNDTLLKLDSINYTNGKYVVNLLNQSKYSMSEIDAKIRLKFNDEKVICETGNITVKGNTFIDYDYELCFENHNKYNDVKWVGSKEEKRISLKSLKYTQTNGKVTSTDYTPCKISIYDNKGNETFDDNFSVKVTDDEIIVFPYKVKGNTKKVYTITQIESGLSVILVLDYIVKDIKVTIPLKVILHSKAIGKDIWTMDGGYMLIDGKDKIMLNPCWLSPNMVDNYDTAYDGNIELTEGKHVFETFNVLCLDQKTKTHKEIKTKEDITISKATKSILITITV